tara:strand:- start:33677 stop:35125 length:1449 start_codon:yes stop_codon:yes gene_type:complete
MAASVQTNYSPSNQNTQSWDVTIDNTRRLFNFGERVAELAPQQSPFFVYLSKVAKKATDDPVFKFLEQRHQWQRRNFQLAVTLPALPTAIGDDSTSSDLGDGNPLSIGCFYDQYGKITSTMQPCYWVKGGDVIQLKDDDGLIHTFKIANSAVEDAAAAETADIGFDHGVTDANRTTVAGLKVHYMGSIDGGTSLAGKTFTGSETKGSGVTGQSTGTAWAEGTEQPQSWEDKLYDREGYCQIFKTAIALFSGTAMATRYRGKADEFKRVWAEKLMEHKMDIEHAMLFGQGQVQGLSSSAETGGQIRYSWGMLPYTYQYGKVYGLSYATSGYDAFLDAMEDYFAPESGNSGNKLVLCSRKIITYLNKIGNGSFLNNSVGSSQYRLDIANVPGAFGHQVTKVNTIFGNLHFVADPLLRGPWEDYAICVDMANVNYRPLAGNGISRDTFIETNIQGNAVDGRQDQIITEAGLEIQLPETHAILKFS